MPKPPTILPRTRRGSDLGLKLVVGLRNPGPEYDGTRHNIGVEVLAVLAHRHHGRFKRGPLRVRCELSDIRVGNSKVLLAAPLSFMNESGGPVKAAMDYHKVGAADLLVLHDDIDLAFGRLRLQMGGGTGGHNGLKSLERSLGTREFGRLKIGVGRPPGRQDPADYVLERFSRSQRPEVDLQVEDAADVVETWLVDRARAQEQAARRTVD
ncbi:MAG: aminoacyl-tRNA hydrolase [Acidimicrobiia bacterium]|nr:aminoacyl-tRNA hydrolase [Acidimicrobiia bacterium]MDH4307129.1 aminoacyl-tRNA hydrolase [Acidimicrobiia bacterium]